MKLIGLLLTYLNLVIDGMADIPQSLYEAMMRTGLSCCSSFALWLCTHAGNVASDTSRYRR
jgi:hypothetical protein